MIIFSFACLAPNSLLNSTPAFLVCESFWCLISGFLSYLTNNPQAFNSSSRDLFYDHQNRQSSWPNHSPTQPGMCEFPVAFLLKQTLPGSIKNLNPGSGVNFSAVFPSPWYDLAYVHQLSIDPPLAPANNCALSLSENKPLISPAFHSSLCLWADCLQDPVFGPSSSHCHFLILNSHFS